MTSSLIAQSDNAITETKDSLIRENKHETNKSNWTIGVHLGLSQSDTDTHSIGRHGGGLFDQVNLAYGLNVKYLLNQNFSIRGD